MTSLKQNELDACVETLSKIEKGFLPLELFEQIARLMRLPIVDTIPIKTEGGETFVGLLQRSEDDIWWPGMWHLPGTILRATDDIQSATKRLLDDEIHLKSSDTPIFSNFILHNSDRGSEVIFIYVLNNCQFDDASPVKWFPINALPKSTIDSELDVIRAINPGKEIKTSDQ